MFLLYEISPKAHMMTLDPSAMYDNSTTLPHHNVSYINQMMILIK
jgi:hypothetical protein